MPPAVHATPTERVSTTEGTGRPSLLRRFVDANRRASRRLEPWLVGADVDVFSRYDDVVAEYVDRAPTPVVVDVGGGRTCSFAASVDRERIRIVAVDISPEELAANHDVDDRRVADVTKEMPFADGEAGLVTSRTLMEHLPDVDAFVRQTARALAPGGYTSHLVPGRYALFAVAARVVPFGPAKRLIHFLKPETEGVIEFPVFYDRCDARALRRTFDRHGLEVTQLDASYSQADYFDAFVPAYVLVALYDRALRLFRARQFASYYLVVAYKPA